MKARTLPQCLGLFLLALAIRWHLAEHLAFDGLYGQDAFVYYHYAQDLREVQLPATAYWPLGFSILIAISGHTPTDAQRLVLLMGAMVAPMVYLLTVESLLLEGWSEAKARRAGLVAGLIMAFCGQLIQSSLVVMSDAPALYWAVFSALTLIYYRQTKSRWRWAWLAITALTLAWATITRWVYGLLIPLWVLYFLLHKRHWGDVLWASAAAVILAAQVMISQQSLVGHAWLEGWAAINALSRDFVNADGTFHYPQRNAIYYSFSLYNGWYLHRIFVITTLIGIGMLSWRRGWFWIGWFGLIWGFLIGIPYQNIRFLLPLMVPVAVWSGVGVAVLWDACRLWGQRYRVATLSLVIRSGLIVAVGMAGWSSYQFGKLGVEHLVETKNVDLLIIRRAEATVEPNAVVYTLSLWPMMTHYSALETRQLFYEDPQTIIEHLPQDRPVYLLINGWMIQNRWQGQRPWLNVQRLAQGPGLIRLALWGNYHLYQVKNQWWGHQ